MIILTMCSFEGIKAFI